MSKLEFIPLDSSTQTAVIVTNEYVTIRSSTGNTILLTKSQAEQLIDEMIMVWSAM